MDPKLTPQVLITPPGNSRRKVIILVFIVLVLLTVTAWALNYFKIIPGYQISSKQTAMEIDGDKIDLTLYNEVLNYVQFYLKDRGKSLNRTNDLFIINKLLKKEALQKGYTLDEKDFSSSKSLSTAQRLETENEFLKEKLMQTTISLYSYELFTLPMYASTLDMPEQEKKKRARDKIDQIKNAWLELDDFEKVSAKFSDDKQLLEITDGGSWGGKFTKVKLKDPTSNYNKLSETLKKLNTGQISEVITLSSVNKENPAPDEYAFAVVKLTDKQGGMADSFEEWLTSTKKKANIKIFIN